MTQATLFEQQTEIVSACCGLALELHIRYKILLAQGRRVVIRPGAFVCVGCGRAVGEGA